MSGIALDTNVLAYAEGVERHPDDHLKVSLSQAIIRGLIRDRGYSAAVQTLAELHAVLVRRARRSPAAATLQIRRLALSCVVVPTSARVLDEALALAADHHLQIYDGVIIAAAAEAGCDLLLSEDMHDGFTWGGVTVVNPFRQSLDERVARVLSPPP